MCEFPALKILQHNSFAFGSNPCVVLKPTSSSLHECLQLLLDTTENFQEFLEEHPDIEEDEPWFGWVFELPDGSLLFESEFYAKAVEVESNRPLVHEYVKRVIRYFVETDAEPGFYVHEEEEGGSKAIEALLMVDAEQYFPTYLEYLKVIDLDHTVEQQDVLFRLNENRILSEEQKEALRETLADLSGGDMFHIE